MKDFVALRKDLDNFRVNFSANTMSSSLTLEEYPKYFSPDEKVKKLSFFFLFRGNIPGFSVTKLLRMVLERDSAKFSEVSDFCFCYCAAADKGRKLYSYSTDDLDSLFVKPKEGFSVKVTGPGYVGRVAWGYCVFFSKDRRWFCCDNSEGCIHLFHTALFDKNTLIRYSFDGLISCVKSHGCVLRGTF